MAKVAAYPTPFDLGFPHLTNAWDVRSVLTFTMTVFMSGTRKIINPESSSL
jgi:hypothetical protein